MSSKQQVLIGRVPEVRIPHAIRTFLKGMDRDNSARELVQMYTSPGEETCEEMPLPERCDEEVGGEPNSYTDGSMLSPKGHRWAIGGICIWWPGRQKEATDKESQWAYCEKTKKGTMLWNIFNTLKYCSTRCEIGATIIAMLPPWATHMGIDNSATVGKGSRRIDHLKKKTPRR